MICIIDYGIGNLAAIHNMLRRLDIESSISSDPAEFARADKLILPGVGAFDEGMKNFHSRGLAKPLEQLVMVEKKPLLGICLGMQLLGTGSDEGQETGLGWLPVRFKRFQALEAHRTKSLHMGWNEITLTRPNILLNHLEQPRFYFVHGYYAVTDRDDAIWGTTTYGIRFPSVIGQDNIMAVQFHPEKSHRFGMKLLINFAGRSNA